MKVKLTGVIQLQTEIETEIDSEEFLDWYRSERGLYYREPLEFEVLHPDDKSMFFEKYFNVYTDDAAEIWATAPQDLNDYEILSADFIEGEVLDDCKS